tara:strand:- start:320 stop:904 length:585 start_codon:yes stop_codon:yes gene_type:complete
MKLLVYMSLLVVGFFTHTNAHSSENRGRVIKIFPQGSPAPEVPKSKKPTEVVPMENTSEDKSFSGAAEATMEDVQEHVQSNENELKAPVAESALKAPLDENNSEDMAQTLEFELHSGLLKPQLDKLVSKYLPSHEIYWGSYEGKHEWYGNQVIKGESLESILNQITSSYGKPPKGIAWYIHLNVVEFVYKNKKG